MLRLIFLRYVLSRFIEMGSPAHFPPSPMKSRFNAHKTFDVDDYSNSAARIVVDTEKRR